MKPRLLISIFSIVLSTAVTIPHVMADETAEKAWKADPQTQRDDQSHRPGPPPHKMHRPDGDEMTGPGSVNKDGPPPPEAGMPPPPPPGNMGGPARRLQRRLMDLNEEASRLSAGEADIKKFQERTAQMKEKGQLTPDREQRLTRMAELRTEMLKLDREEFVGRTKQESGKMLEMIQEHLDSVETAPQGPPELATKAKETLEKINASATDFETLAKALTDLAPDLPSGSMGGSREDRFRREIEVLKHRMDNLRQEYGDGDSASLMDDDQGPPHRMPPNKRREIKPEDDGMYQGLKEPPPAARKKDSQSGVKQGQESGKGNDTK